MWRRLRKFLLLLLTISAGLLAGVLIRFGFGHGLQWQSVAKKPAVIPVRVPGIEGKAPADSAELPPASAAENDPVLVRLRAIAGNDYATLERLLQDEFDREMDRGYLGSGASTLIKAMISLDPLRTMAWAEKVMFGSSTRSYVYDLWRKQDQQAADAWAAAQAPELLKRALRYPTLEDADIDRMLRENPGELDALLSRKERDPNLLGRVARRRAAEDPAAAFQWAQSLSRPGDRTKALGQTFEGWVKKDPAAAAAAWKSLPKGEAAHKAFDLIQSSLPPDQAVAWLRSLEPSQMVRRALADRLPDGAERDAVLATLPASAAERHPVSAETRLFQAIQKGPSPEAFAALAQASRAGTAVDDGVAGILFKRDPSGTLAALQALPDGKFKTEAAARIGEFLADQPETGAMELFATLPAGPFRDAAAERLAMGMSKTSPRDAMEFLQSQSAEARSRALPEIMRRWISQEPGQAQAAWAALPESDRRGASAELAAKLAVNPNASSVALLSALPEVPPSAFKEAASNWIASAPEQASAWVDTLAPGAGRDAAVGSLVESLVGQEWDPERAVVWAGTIGDAAQRLTSLRTTLEIWSLRDPSAAQSARQSLSAEDQQALTNP